MVVVGREQVRSLVTLENAGNTCYRANYIAEDLSTGSLDELRLLRLDRLDTKVEEFEKGADELSDLLKGLQELPRRCKDAADKIEQITYSYDVEMAVETINIPNYPLLTTLNNFVIDITKRLDKRKVHQTAHDIAKYIDSSFPKIRKLLFGEDTLEGRTKGLYIQKETVSEIVRQDEAILAADYVNESSLTGNIKPSAIELSAVDGNELSELSATNLHIDKKHKPLNEVLCMDWNKERLRKITSAVDYLENAYHAINGISFEIRLISERVGSKSQPDNGFSKDALRLVSLLQRIAYNSVAACAATGEFYRAAVYH